MGQNNRIVLIEGYQPKRPPRPAGIQNGYQPSDRPASKPVPPKPTRAPSAIASPKK